MHDPISSFYRIRDFYISYLETAFRIGDSNIQADRRALLEKFGTLCQEPYVEPLPSYPSSGIRVNDLLTKHEDLLPKFSESERQAFIELALSGLLPASKDDAKVGRFSLYQHQLEMLRKGVSVGCPGIVTSGTGSGKTESFLLPIFAAIAKEAKSWPKGRISEWTPWWRASSEGPNSCRSEPYESSKRPKAIRALILYPMNALVEDQMVRLRRALDSDRAHQTMDEHFSGNRIFFGRYTGATPVTGWVEHPRIVKFSTEDAKKERLRSKNRIANLKKYLLDLDDTQNEITRMIAESSDEKKLDDLIDLPYNFPRADGNEVVSRWEMQSTPPDILITNTSMLSTMLVREIEESIFKQTREWIENNDDSYFYLVIDELHLHRGSSGTEVSYLIKSFLNRLGLSDPRHAHKLRILCSSASLPLDEQNKRNSLDYLEGFFGAFGLGGSGDLSKWAEAIVSGPRPIVPSLLDYSNSENLYKSIYCFKESVLDSTFIPNKIDLNQLSTALGIDSNLYKSTEILLAECVKQSGFMLEHACFAQIGEKNNIEMRASSLSDISTRLFSSDNDFGVRAVEALVWLRSITSFWPNWFKTNFDETSAPRFRVHTFLRAIEGLFVAPKIAPITLEMPERVSRLFGDLTIESGERYGNRDGDAPANRRIEVLYCECCGTLFYGGKKGSIRSDFVELLPNDPDTDQLPERSKALIVGDRSAVDYSLFMPTVDQRFWPYTDASPNSDDSQGEWRPAVFDPRTAIIYFGGEKLHSKELIQGWYYNVDSDLFKDTKRHKKPSDPKTALPYQCPSCEISYKNKQFKFSPIRGFRVGFSKTTQLLASSLMGELYRSSNNEQEHFVTFSDSRQDAARAALDLESGHHQDVRREIVVKVLEDLGDSYATLANLKQEQIDLEEQVHSLIVSASASPSDRDMQMRLSALFVRQAKIEELIKAANKDYINVADYLEPKAPVMGESLNPILHKLVDVGIHPTDPVGIAQIPKITRLDKPTELFSWQQLFMQGNNGWCWVKRDGFDDVLRPAFDEVSEDMASLLGETLFSETYFAVEEAGWGYPCFKAKDGDDRKNMEKFDAMLRVTADQFRIQPSFSNTVPTSWDTAANIGARSKLRKFAKAAFASKADDILSEFLSLMSSNGHLRGIINVRALSYRPVGTDSPFWRCRCGRVHLHRGAGICTRCYTPLPDSQTGQAISLRESNFLGKRILESMHTYNDIYRLRAEELTGITTNPAARLRRFKGILIKDDDDMLAPNNVGLPVNQDLDRKARLVDVLSVTTTMEVGVDIGDLRSVFQANMPPQRFNYQQRVGRAGRRGQAFSYVLTVCRSKSHDLHYFRYPEQITGDPPPPPFLTMSLGQILERVVRKNWLVEAFRDMRLSTTGYWEADRMLSNPDGHGEFIRICDIGNLSIWLARLQRSLEKTISIRDELSEICAFDTKIRDSIIESLSVNRVINDITDIIKTNPGSEAGLGQMLAEKGLFPMYGMPTRTKLLLMRPTVESNNSQNVIFSTMDRDVDVAIQEFAPGRLLVKDKRSFLTAGLVGGDFTRARLREGGSVYPPKTTFGTKAEIVECPECRSMSHARDGQPSNEVCQNCGSLLTSAEVFSTYEPDMFVTSMMEIPHDESVDEINTKASKTSVSFAKPTKSSMAVENTNLRLSFDDLSELVRLNKGVYADNKWTGFSVLKGKLRAPLFDGGRDRTIHINDLWIDKNLYEVDKASSNGNLSSLKRFTPTHGDSAEIDNFYLSSSKITSSIIIEPEMMNEVYAFHNAATNAEFPITAAFRSGAISACSLIVDYASRELFDVDPSEFEILPPTIRMRNGKKVLSLQLADELVNGSGLSSRLAQMGSSGEPNIVEVMRLILSDEKQSLFTKFAKDKLHYEKCLTACYRCMHRYGNQQYHGLLDWRLGFDLLRILLDPNFTCGIHGGDNNKSAWGWEYVAEQLAQEAASLFACNVTRLPDVPHIPIIEITDKNRAAVIHPFWSEEYLRRTYPRLLEINHFVTTFDLARKMGDVMIRLKEVS